MTKTLLVIVCLSTRLALAEEAAPDAASSPGFALLERFDADGRLGLEAGYMREDGYGSGRLDFHGHFVAANNFGGYVQVQASDYVGHREYPYDTNNGGLGAPEVGALWVSHGHDLAIIFRLGVVIPTTDAGYDPIEVLTARPNDVIQHLGGVGFARFGTSFLLRRGRMFYRVDAGVDASLFVRDGQRIVSAYGARLGLGLGLDLGHVAVMAELSAMGLVGRQEEERAVIRRTTETEAEAYAAPAITVRGRASAVQPYASVCAPSVASWSVIVGTDLSFD